MPRESKDNLTKDASDDTVPIPLDMEDYQDFLCVPGIICPEKMVLLDPKWKWPDDFYDESKKIHGLVWRYQTLAKKGTQSGFNSTDLDAPTLHPQWIYPSQIRAWVETCDSRHGTHCQPPRRDQHSPSWLIDCETACLVRAMVGMPYVALSYVWGPTASGMTLRKNLSELQHNGAFMDMSIPLTIQNVIAMIPQIGERCL